MVRKGFVNQKLGKQTTHRQAMTRLKSQFDRRINKQRGVSSNSVPKSRKSS